MLKIKDLCFSYSKGDTVISNLDMELGNGVVCGLLGKNGAGKTTLLYLICGLLRPRSGNIIFNGYCPSERSTEFLSDVFIVPEEFSLPNITLKEYVAINSPFYPKFDMQAMNRYLEIFELDSNTHLGKISMGQKKKAFISIAMACNTNLLILDEPTNGLDISSKRNFRRAISECMDDEKSIIISTHQVYDVDKLIDHVIITDRRGILLNRPIGEIQKEYRFGVTTDRKRASEALISLDVPRGMNIMERCESDDEETVVNLETLFEYVMQLEKRK